MNKNNKILIFDGAFPDDLPQIGTLFTDEIRGSELFSFEYDPDWLISNSPIIPFDPDLSFFRGRQYPRTKKLFGIFSDSCPDRWGRTLIKRKEAINAKKEGRKPRTLSESDYLLGVSDLTRMGALRFRTTHEGPFLAEDTDFAVPPWVKLRELEYSSYSYNSDDPNEGEKWLRQILSPGSSLGGARPKASVQAPDGSLWIAKFPSKNDDHNYGAWEMTLHDLAYQCGLSVPDARLETFSKYGSTYLVKRFDRNRNVRVHFASAMTMLGKMDGDGAETGVSYQDIAAFICSNGFSPEEDLPELWKRIVFSIAVSNTDDHLRNHGFLRMKNGWKLSPMFDVNPVPEGDRLSLNISENDNIMSFDLAIDCSSVFGIGRLRAEKIVHDFSELIKSEWEQTAVKYGIKRSEIELMRPAFANCY